MTGSSTKSILIQKSRHGKFRKSSEAFECFSVSLNGWVTVLQKTLQDTLRTVGSVRFPTLQSESWCN